MALLLIYSSFHRVCNLERSFLACRFFLGSNKVMQISLGRSASDEGKPSVHKVAKVSLHSFIR